MNEEPNISRPRLGVVTPGQDKELSSPDRMRCEETILRAHTVDEGGRSCARWSTLEQV